MPHRGHRANPAPPGNSRGLFLDTRAVFLRVEIAEQLGNVLPQLRGWPYWMLFWFSTGMATLLAIAILDDGWRTDRFEARDSKRTLSWWERIRAVSLLTAVLLGVICVIWDEPFKRSYGFVAWFAASVMLAARSWTDYAHARERERRAEDVARQRQWWRSASSRWNPLRPRRRRSVAERFAIEWIWLAASWGVGVLWGLFGAGEGVARQSLSGF